MTQMVKNLCAMQKTWVRSLGWEDPLEKGIATRSSILAWRIPLEGLITVNSDTKKLAQSGSAWFPGPGWLTDLRFVAGAEVLDQESDSGC